MKKIVISNGNEVPVEWKRTRRRNKDVCGVREPLPTDVVKKWGGGEYTPDPQTHMVIVRPDGSIDAIEKNILAETWEEFQPGKWKKRKATVVVEVPRDVTVTLHTMEHDTIEGVRTFGAFRDGNKPRYIMIGWKNEVFAADKTKVDSGFEILKPVFIK